MDNLGKPRSSSWRLIVYLSAAITMSVLVFGVIAYLHDRQASQEKEDALADLSSVMKKISQEEPNGWDFEALERGRTSVPKEKNGADVIAETVAALPADWEANQKLTEINLWGFGILSANPSVALGEEKANRIRKELDKIRPALQKAQKLLECPTGRFPPVVIAPDYFFHTVKNHHKDIRLGVQLRMSGYSRMTPPLIGLGIHRMEPNELSVQARTIWQAALNAVRPEPLVRQALRDPARRIGAALAQAKRMLVFGGGKAGAAMSAAVEDALASQLEKVDGIVNVPAETVRPLRRIRLHAARPAGSNQPTSEGVAGSEEILRLARSAGPNDVALCLLSGGGSALLPAPASGLTLEDKQAVTQLLHACGATISDMNAVRKHLSAFKGGRLADAFTGKTLFSLIISDVVGDPLDVIASGPTAADPTTFAQALAVLEKFNLTDKVPAAVLAHLRHGAAGHIPETLKTLPEHVHNFILGNNANALAAAQIKAETLGYRVLNLGSFIEGETREVAVALAGIVRSIRHASLPIAPPACILSGGETTVTLTPDHGRGGRNQEFVLAALGKLGPNDMRGVIVLSGGTDGEDGPTDAAGAVADEQTLPQAALLGLDWRAFLDRHDAYTFFERTGSLLKTGLTMTNVMDVRVILVE